MTRTHADSWEARKTVEGPGRRDYGVMVYAAGIGRMILFGEGEPLVKNDTWAYDFDTNTWTELKPAASPDECGWHDMAYSSAAERIILFGGGRDRDNFALEMWAHDPNKNIWAQVGP